MIFLNGMDSVISWLFASRQFLWLLTTVLFTSRPCLVSVFDLSLDSFGRPVWWDDEEGGKQTGTAGGTCNSTQTLIHFISVQLNFNLNLVHFISTFNIQHFYISNNTFQAVSVSGAYAELLAILFDVSRPTGWSASAFSEASLISATCNSYFWSLKNKTDRRNYFYDFWYFVSRYAIMLLIFIFWYGRILV